MEGDGDSMALIQAEPLQPSPVPLHELSAAEDGRVVVLPPAANPPNATDAAPVALAAAVNTSLVPVAASIVPSVVTGGELIVWPPPVAAPGADEAEHGLPPEAIGTLDKRREELRVQRTLRAALNGLFTDKDHKNSSNLTPEQQNMKCQAIVQVLREPERTMLLEHLVHSTCRKRKSPEAKLSKRTGKRMATVIAPMIQSRFGDTPEEIQEGLQAVVDEALGSDQASVIVLTKKSKMEVERDMTKVLLEHSGMTVARWRKTRSELKPHFARVGGIEFLKSWVYADGVRNDDPNLPRPEPCIRGQGADRVRNEGGEVRIAQPTARIGYTDSRGSRGRGSGSGRGKGRSVVHAAPQNTSAPLLPSQQVAMRAPHQLPAPPMVPPGVWGLPDSRLPPPPASSRPGDHWPALHQPPTSYLPQNGFRGW